MEFFSLTFIFFFLPLSMAFYYFSPNKYKYVSLLIISLAFYLTLSEANIYILLVMTFTDYIFGLLIGRLSKRKIKKTALFFTVINVIKNLAIFSYFSVILTESGIAVAGVMVVALCGISYSVDIYKKELEAEKNLLLYAVYSLFFGKIFYGPFVRFGEIRYPIKEVHPSLTSISKGAVMLISAVAKKVILADSVRRLYTDLAQISHSNSSVLGIWLLVISFTFSLYFTLSAYFDMAQAIAYLFSFKLPVSFYYPFMSRSVDEFFARFNITINQFVRKYVYMQLGEKSGGFLSASLNIILVSMLISLWYGITPNYLLWGIYLALFIIGEQYLYPFIVKNTPDFISRMMTFCVTIFSFVFITASSIPEAIFYIRSMFNLSDLPATDNITLYLLSANMGTLILCVVLCSSIYSVTAKFMDKHYPTTWQVISSLQSLLLLFLSVVFMV